MHLALSSRAIVCGDFNAHHPWWNSRIGSLVRADNLVTWLSARNCTLMNTPDESTYTQYRQNGARSVLDLIFATEQLAEIAANWAILGEAAIGLDHEVIYFELLLDSAAFVENPMMTASIFNTERAEWGKFHNCLVADWASTKIRIDELLALNTECGMD